MPVPESTASELLADLGRLATALGPAVRPAGTDRQLGSITTAARELFGAGACSLALLSDDGSELVYTTAAGAGAGGVTGMRLPAGQGLAGWVVMSGQPVAVDDLAADPRFARDVAEGTGYVPRAMLAVPVAVDDEVLGVLTVLDRDAARAGADRDMVLLQLFADQAAHALEATRAFGDLGRVLLRALAAAAADGTALADALAGAGGPGAPDPELTELAALLAVLGRQGPAERRLAVRIVREVAEHTARSARRRR